MRKQTKKLAIAAVTVCLVAAVAMSKTARATVSDLFASLNRVRAAEKETRGLAAATSGDVEQRARVKHGWGPVNNVIMRGTIIFFVDDLVRRQANLTIYRKFPDRVRVEVEQDGLIEAFGFDHSDPWKQNVASLTEAEARDIRSWLRLSPERLFVMRGGGGAYRELGNRLEDTRPNIPGFGPKDLRPAKTLDVVEVEDTIGLPPAAPNPGDRRLINYFIDRTNSIVYSERWLEPDDPTQMADDGSLPSKEVRVDYGDWRRVESTLWPLEITHWLGGKVDFLIMVNEVLVNQPMPDTVFQNPGR